MAVSRTEWQPSRLPPQGMEVRSGIVHVFGTFGGFERRGDPPRLPSPSGVDASCLPPGPVVAKPPVPKAADHDVRVRTRDNVVRHCLTVLPSPRPSEAAGSPTPARDSQSAVGFDSPVLPALRAGTLSAARSGASGVPSRSSCVSLSGSSGFPCAFPTASGAAIRSPVTVRNCARGSQADDLGRCCGTALSIVADRSVADRLLTEGGRRLTATSTTAG